MDRSIRVWLLVVMGLVAAIVVIGGITRLTGSGLSMVDWRPVMGILPPIGDMQWQQVFDAYQATPEYEKINQGMSLRDFKGIFFWEYLHRILGRVIGLSILIPYLYFLIRGKLVAPFKWQWLLVIFLVICQGLMGWYMVMSGLVDRPSVSHFRLASHLVLALVIYSIVCWHYLRQRFSGTKINTGLNRLIISVFSLSWLQIIYGAFTAGLDGGKYYNTYPKMGGDWLPESAFMYDGGIIGNLLTNPIMVQWFHRWLAVILVVLSIYLVRCCVDSGRLGLQYSGLLLLAVIFFQFILGVTTLISGVWLPVAVMHQFGGLMLITSIIFVLYFSTYGDWESIS